jgi:hypothetical protein
LTAEAIKHFLFALFEAFPFASIQFRIHIQYGGEIEKVPGDQCNPSSDNMEHQA